MTTGNFFPLKHEPVLDPLFLDYRPQTFSSWQVTAFPSTQSISLACQQPAFPFFVFLFLCLPTSYTNISGDKELVSFLSRARPNSIYFTHLKRIIRKRFFLPCTNNMQSQKEREGEREPSGKKQQIPDGVRTDRRRLLQNKIRGFFARWWWLIEMSLGEWIFWSYSVSFQAGYLLILPPPWRVPFRICSKVQRRSFVLP